MTDSETLYDLLAEYEAAVERGESPTPEVVCAGRPDLLPEFRRRVSVLAGFDRAFAGAATQPEAAEPPPPPDLDIAGHVVVAEVGRGGMGVVYLARQPGLNRLVALKLLLGGRVASPSQRARFRLEAEAVARLRHPNIVGVIQVGEHDGQPFLTLEYCPGGSLAERLRAAGPFEPRAAAGLVRALAGAVQAAHDAGIVHRDLKPGNVLLDEHATPKVADFGLAKDLDASDDRTGEQVVGTPAYMAPEQAAGRNRDVGPLADVWALGGILYALLTGRPPFLGTSHDETRRLVLTADPAPPRRANRAIPRDLETICLKCLEKEPNRRYGSAQALADDLGRFLDGRPVHARPVGPLGRAWRFGKRYPVQVGLALAVVASLAVGAAVATGYAWRAERLAGEKADEAARANAARSRAESLLYARQLADLHAGWRDGWALAAVRDQLDRCPEEPRGWEHAYLRRLAAPAWADFRGESQVPTVAVFDPDGKRFTVAGSAVRGELAIGPSRGVLDRFEVGSGVRLSPLAEWASPVVAVSCRGGELHVACADGTVRRHDAATGAALGQWKAATPLRAACRLDDDRVAVVGGSERKGTVAVHEAVSGKVVWSRQEPRGVAAVVAAGRHLATGEAGEVVLRDAATGEPGRRLAAGGEVTHLWASTEANLLLARTAPPLDGPGETVAWALDAGAVLYRLPGGPLAVGPGDRLVTAGPDGVVTERDPRTGRERSVRRLLGHTGLTVGQMVGQALPSGGDKAGLSIRPGAAVGRPAEVARREAVGEPAEVAALAAHPDGRRLLVVTAKGSALLLDDRDFDPRSRHLPGQLAAWSTDSLLVAADGTVRRLDPATGAVRDERRGDGRAVPVVPVALAAAPEGPLLAVAVGSSLDGGRRGAGEVQLWDGDKGAVVRRLAGAGATVKRLGWSADGKLLAGVRGDGGLVVWDATDGRVVVAPGPAGRDEGSPLSDPVFAADGKAVAYEPTGGKVRVVEPLTGRDGPTFQPGDGRGPFDTFGGSTAQLAFLGEKALVAAGPTLVTWDRTDGRRTARVPLAVPARVVAVDPVNRRFAVFTFVAERDRPDRPAVQMRDLTDGQVLRECADVPAGYWAGSLRFSGDGKLLAGTFQRTDAGETTSRLVVWEAATGRATFAGPARPGGVGACAFAASGRALFVARDDRLDRLDPATGQVVATLRPTAEVPPTLTVLAGDIVTGSADGAVTFFEPGGSRTVATLPASVGVLAVAPDGGRIAAGTAPAEGKAVLAVHARDGRRLWATDGPGWRQVAFSPDGRLLFVLQSDSLDGDPALEVRDAATGEVVVRVAVPERPVGLAVTVSGRAWLFTGDGKAARLAFDDPVTIGHRLPGPLAAGAASPDGRRLVTVPADGQGRPVGPTLWDAVTGHALFTLDPVDVGKVAALAFSPDGRFLALTGAKGTFVWEAAKAE